MFSSKLCHFFLLPNVFPVVDRSALRDRWPTYAAYFRYVQNEWDATSPATRDELAAEVTRLIGVTGQDVSGKFPMINKITELWMIGRCHPSGH